MAAARRSRRAPRPPKEWRSRSESSLLIAAGLRAAELARGPLRAFGVEPDQFRELLRVRLVLELRSSGNLGLGSVGIILGVLFFWPTGILAGVAALLIEDPMPWIAGSQAFLMVTLGMLLLMQYASILVDPTDVAVAASRPVADRTLFAARIAHLTLYVTSLSAIFASGSIMLGVFGQPWWAVLLVYPLVTALSTALTVGLVAGLFALILRVFGPRLFQRATLWIQVALFTVLMGGGQAVQFLKGTGFGAWLEQLGQIEWLRFWLPPFHYAGLFDLVVGDVTRANLIHAGLAFLLPALALWITLRLASRYFVQGLEGGLEMGRTPRSGWRAGWASRLGALACRSRAERAAYDLAVAYSRRDPIFLRQGLPGLIAFPIVGGVLSIQMRDTPWALGAASFMALMAFPSVLEAARYTQHPEARWSYWMGTASSPSELLRGAIKGLFLGSLLPMCLLLAVVALAIHGFDRLFEAVVAIELVALVMLRFTLGWFHGMPFTLKHNMSDVNWANVPLVFGVMGCGLLVAGLQGLLCWYPWTALASCVLLAPLVVRAFRRLDELELPASALSLRS